MKIDTSQGDIEVVGDVKEFKTSIDPKNLEFITTLLSSNLYSDPEQSFIREIVSNAWDSHVEAGTTDIPVIIRFRRFDGKYGVTIRDYGTGISPERFKEIYCNIGSSTKRETNDYIGGFGIGKYSSLACSNTVYITSYYEGIAYYYIMVKSGNSITTNLLMEKPTSEKNGVEVTIKGISDINPFNKALNCVVFFPNIYIDNADNADRINSAKLKRFNNFAAASIPISSKLLLGNVLYPINTSLLSSSSVDFIRKIQGTGVVIKFDVGELNITPNRENIIYNSDTIKKIEDRIMKAEAELNSLADAKLSRDYDDILDYYEAIRRAVGYDPVEDSIIPDDYYNYYKVFPSDAGRGSSITYRGNDLRKYSHILANVLSIDFPNFKGSIYDDRIYSKKLPWRIASAKVLSYPKVVMLNAGARLIEAARLYLRENYNKYSIITYIDKTGFTDYVENYLKAIHCSLPNSPDIRKIIIEGAYESLIGRSVMLDLDNDTEFLKYKASLASCNPIDRKKEISPILYVFTENGYKQKMVFSKFSDAVNYIKSIKKGIILTNMDADEHMFSTIACFKGYTYIKARKDIVSALKELNLKCMVDIDWVTKKDPTLSIVKTLVKCFPSGMDIHDVHDLECNIDKDTWKEFNRLLIIDISYRSDTYYRGLALKDNIPYDDYTEYLCSRLKKYITEHQRAKSLSNTIGCDNPIITTAVIVKTKAYRVSGDAYKRIKNNKLLNVLCRK